MKKAMVICVCLAVFLISGCDSMFKYDITLKNDTTGTLWVNLSSSSSAPSSFYTLKKSEGHTFTDIESGRYYVFVKETQDAETGRRFDVDISSDTTYFMIREGGEIVLQYYK